MGFNLLLFCERCRVRAFLWRGHEAEGIDEWSKLHGDHGTEASVDNGLAEKPWTDADDLVEITLPSGAQHRESGDG